MWKEDAVFISEILNRSKAFCRPHSVWRDSAGRRETSASFGTAERQCSPAKAAAEMIPRLRRGEARRNAVRVFSSISVKGQKDSFCLEIFIRMEEEREKDTYQNPLIERYTSREMSAIFSPDKKFTTWRELWIALAEAEKELGLDITQEQIDELKAHKDDINYEVARAREKEVRHDVMSHVYAYGVQCPKAKESFIWERPARMWVITRISSRSEQALRS